MKRGFSQRGLRRSAFMLLGNLLIAFSISVMRLAGLGNSSFSAMLIALETGTGMSYGTLHLSISIVLLLIEWLTGRRYIGIGTLVNGLFLGYFANFFSWLLSGLFAAPEILWQQILVLLLGVVISSLGVSLYQTADMGTSPYDSMSLIMAERGKRVSYFWWRMLTDGTCIVIAILAGGMVGIGPFVAAFCTGPIVQFFNVHLTEKWIGREREGQNT